MLDHLRYIIEDSYQDISDSCEGLNHYYYSLVLLLTNLRTKSTKMDMGLWLNKIENQN